ncbi:MFS transporter [Streptomyces sp. NPDC012421]|uniref:MFS transporter n=1 Tax=unclassified Streptomyces TaxID=2593676 RepID=UPI0036C1F85B
MTSERRSALFGLNAGIFLAHIGNFIWFPILVASLGDSDSGFWAGVVMCMTYVGRLAATFSYEGFSDRLGIRGAVFVGTGLEAVSLGLMGFTSGVAVYSLLALFIGFGSGTAFPGLKNILVSYPEDERAKAFSTFQMSAQVGLFGGALAGGLLLGMDLRVVFTAVFVLFLGFCLSASLFIPRDGFQADGTAAPRKDAGAERAPLFSLAGLKSVEVGGATRYFLLSAAFWFLSLCFVVGIPLHMGKFVPQWAPSAPFWITGLSLLVLQYPVFKLAIKHLRPGVVMGIGLTAMAAAFVLFGSAPAALWAVAAGCFVVVFGEILFVPSFDMWVSRKVPEQQLARAMGAMHFFRSAGNMAGALLAGVMFDVSVSADLPGANWYAAAAVAALCAVICFAGRDQDRSGADAGEDAEPSAEPVTA